MSEDVRDLIAQIKEDGIRAAEEKAREIEGDAQRRADGILSEARQEADRMVAAAGERIRREEENGKIALAQAGRDLLLSLRNEILATLERVMVTGIRSSLDPGTLSALITEVVRRHGAGDGGPIEMLLSGEDLERLENHFLHRLGEEIGKEIVVRPSAEVSGGFVISFDGGKSCHEFTDRALADYIGTYLKPKLNRILQDAVRD